MFRISQEIPDHHRGFGGMRKGDHLISHICMEGEWSPLRDDYQQRFAAVSKQGLSAIASDVELRRQGHLAFFISLRGYVWIRGMRAVHSRDREVVLRDPYWLTCVSAVRLGKDCMRKIVPQTLLRSTARVEEA